ncbi:MAG TPA: M50 family metallopeptidase [Myxococcaceae bacterium]|nr:M50 family metallopeptidase [Myxococcaceae bacterium]
MKTASGAKLNWARLVTLVLCLSTALLFWDSRILLPLKLLVVMLHETGHALASLLVGGSVQKVNIAVNQSGQCLSMLPPGWFAKVVVYSAGYLGSALAGALLILATFRFSARRWVLGILCAWLMIMGVFYAGDVFTFVFCVGTALALGLAARLLPPSAVDLLNLFIAAFAGLYALFDLRDDLWSGAARSHSDAALLANLTYVPAIVWAALWTVIGVALLAVFAWISVQKGKATGFSIRRSMDGMPATRW